MTLTDIAFRMAARDAERTEFLSLVPAQIRVYILEVDLLRYGCHILETASVVVLEFEFLSRAFINTVRLELALGQKDGAGFTIII